MQVPQKNIPTYNVALQDCSIETKDIEMFELHRLEDILKVTENISFPHRHSFFNLLYFKEGSGTHTIDFVEYEVKPNRVFFMAEGQVHSWELSNDTTGYTLFFTREFFELHMGEHTLFDFNFFFDSYLPAYVDYSDEQFGKALSMLGMLEGEEKHISTNGDIVIWSYLNILLFKVKIELEKETVNHSQDYSIVKEFQSLVNQHFNDMKKVADYAEVLHINPNYLSTLCKQATGTNAKEMLNDRVLLEAKRLLYNSKLSISEIAYHLNFNDNSYFSRFFRRSVGMSPELFRKGKKG